MPSSPGTVSKILWHFTGGALREPPFYRPQSTLKSPEDSFKGIVSILKSKELRLGGGPERIDVMRVIVRLDHPW
jgi:hypothetical protein